MSKVVVLGAGGPAGVSWCHALHEGGHQVVALDDNAAHLVWCEDYAFAMQGSIEAVDGLGADLVWACPDNLALKLARAKIETPRFLPRVDVIERCQDKLATADAWYRAGLRSLPPVPIDGPLPDALHAAKDAFGLPFWLRATSGAGAKGATLVDDLRTGFHWLRYWETRGSDADWVCEEFLPGRDYAWTGLYANGELIASFARERLEYIYPHLTPDGLTGTPTIAQVVHDQDVNATAEAAIACVDDRPNGMYAVDLREDIDGVPRPTEINAGRGGTTVGLWSLYGLNFAALAVAAGTGCPLPAGNRDPLPTGLRLSRHIDCAGVFTQHHPIELKEAA